MGVSAAPSASDERQADRGPFHSAFEKAIVAEGGGGWVLLPPSKPLVRTGYGRPTFFERWIRDGRVIELHYWVCDSPQEVAQLLAEDRILVAVTPHEINGIGDEAFFTEAAPDGSVRIHFRRKTGLFELTAPTEEVVRRIARAFVAEMD